MFRVKREGLVFYTKGLVISTSESAPDAFYYFTFSHTFNLIFSFTYIIVTESFQ